MQVGPDAGVGVAQTGIHPGEMGAGKGSGGREAGGQGVHVDAGKAYAPALGFNGG